jgi:DNA-binding GntR family transcriptional regulator
MGRAVAGATRTSREVGPLPDPTGLADLPAAIDRRLSVSDQVYAALHDAIVSTRLMPDTAISENSISRQFNVSRTPVRAAIQKLSEEGLVDVFPQLGSYVSRIDLARIQDSHFVRKSIEVCLLREVAVKWNAKMSRAVREVIHTQVSVIAAGDVDGFFREDEAFHHLFAVFAGREGVWPTVLNAKRPLIRFLRLAGRPDRLPAVPSEHLAIVEALDAGDPERAERALVEHLDKNFVLFEALPSEERARFVA